MGIEQIFQDPFAFVVAIGSVVAFLRKHVVPVDGKLVVGLSVVVGVALGYAGHAMGYYQYPDWLIYGAVGGLVTSGFVDFLRAILKMFGDFIPKETREKIEKFLAEYEEKADSVSTEPQAASPQAKKADRGKTKLL